MQAKTSRDQNAAPRQRSTQQFVSAHQRRNVRLGRETELNLVARLMGATTACHRFKVLFQTRRFLIEMFSTIFLRITTCCCSHREAAQFPVPVPVPAPFFFAVRCALA